jgi:hypothetical protein
VASVTTDELSWYRKLFADLGTTVRRDADSMYGIGALACRLGVSSRRIRRWEAAGHFPRTCHWREGRDHRGDRRLYTEAMVNAAEEVAIELGLADKRRWNLSESEFGLRIAQRWRRSEEWKLDPDLEWCGERGWLEARPRSIVDYSDPDRVAAAYNRAQSAPADDIIDMSSPKAHRAAANGHPIIVG